MGFNSAFKGLNTELNPICHLLALLETHYILHVSRIRVKLQSTLSRSGDITQLRTTVFSAFHVGDALINHSNPSGNSLYTT